MVQLLADPALASPDHQGHQSVDGGRFDQHDGVVMSREEHAKRMRELQMKRGLAKTPKRGWSMTDYQGEHQGFHHFQPVAAHTKHEPSIPENGPLPSPPTTPVTSGQPLKELKAPEQTTELPLRPKLPPPRRSYSVMDYEPVPPGQPRPSNRLALLDLPSEIHYTLFDFLDPIDGICLGLAHSRLYDISRRKYGTVPLSSRYSGPNDMEWAWRGAAPKSRSDGREVAAKQDQVPPQPNTDLVQHRVKGQVYCRKCGIYRCELHRHLKDWFGADYEYCEIRKTYGAPAGVEAKAHCYMSSPKNPHRCGRHGGKKTTT